MGLRNMLFAYFGIMIAPLIKASLYEIEKNLHTSLMTGYDKNIRPRGKDFEKTNIGFGIYLISLTKLDTVDGILTTTALMSVYWTDNNLRWNPSEHGNITDIPIQRDMIWSPRFTLLNTATKAESLGVSVSQTYLYWIGRVLWQFGHVMQSICDIDVTYFPFDIQRCVIELVSVYKRNSSTNEFIILFWKSNVESEVNNLRDGILWLSSISKVYAGTWKTVHLLCTESFFSCFDHDVFEYHGVYFTGEQWGTCWILDNMSFIAFGLHDFCIRKFAKCITTAAFNNLCFAVVHRYLRTDLCRNNPGTEVSLKWQFSHPAEDSCQDVLPIQCI